MLNLRLCRRRCSLLLITAPCVRIMYFLDGFESNADGFTHNPYRLLKRTMRYFFTKIGMFLCFYFLWSLVFNTGILPFKVQAADAIVVDRIVAVVNDDLITLYDLNNIEAVCKKLLH